MKYMAVYRTTPHHTTGKTPAFLLIGRHPRTKLPQLSQPVHGDEETRDRDQAMKFKSKQYADTKRNVRTSDVQPDDIVLLRQEEKQVVYQIWDSAVQGTRQKRKPSHYIGLRES